MRERVQGCLDVVYGIMRSDAGHVGPEMYSWQMSLGGGRATITVSGAEVDMTETVWFLVRG